MRQKIKLNVVLLKKNTDFCKPEDFISDYSAEQVIALGKRVDMFLYKKVGGVKQPDWVISFGRKIGGVDLSAIFPASQNYGVSLFLKIDDRVFVINWGALARFNVLPDFVDKKFGIYTASKILSENTNAKIKSVQSRVNETNPINKQRQYGEDVSTEELFLSMEDNEALKELIVQDKSSVDFQKLIGKFSSLNVQFLFEEHEMPCLDFLPVRLRKLLNIFKSFNKEDIKKLYKGLWPVEEPSIDLIEELENQITKSGESLFLFEPEIDFDFSAVSRVKFVVGGKEVLATDFLLAEYLKEKPAPKMSDLRSDRVMVLDEDEKEIKTWSLFDCLYGEIACGGINYILSHAEWFEIASDKYSRITKKIDSIIDNKYVVSQNVKDKTKAAIGKAKADRKDKERIFNRSLSEELGGELFDEVIKQISLYEDKFEVCDVFVSNGKEFIHTKYNYGAQSLSHLFNQGYVSAFAYARFSAEFSQKVNNHIKNSGNHVPIDHRGSLIHYLIINDRRDNRLTFFSKMALENRISTLEAMNFKIKLSWVNDVY